ncbi:MAG: hypothetical protein KGS72_28505 [Cyanobacteria bacterium REEB67]|nr:hypothetical protein [Cyanobacteria bacterium REEB67]
MSKADLLEKTHANAQATIDPLSALKQSFAAASPATIERTLMRILDIQPHVYMLASSSLRVQSKKGQDLLDNVEVLLSRMIDIPDRSKAEWLALAEAVDGTFHNIDMDDADTLAVLEYAMGRTLLFGRLFRKVDSIAPIFSALTERHFTLVKSGNVDVSYLPELAVAWLTHCHSDLLEEWFENFIELLDDADLRLLNDVAGGAWIAAIKSDKEIDDDRQSLFFETLKVVTAKAGLSELVRLFVASDLENLEDYSESIEIMEGLGQEAEAGKLAFAAYEKLGAQAHEEFLSYFIDRHTAAGDFEAAAEEYLKAMAYKPSLFLHGEFIDYIEEYNLPKLALAERAREIVRAKIAAADECDLSEAKTVLGALSILAGDISAGLEVVAEGNGSAALIRLLKSTIGQSQSYEELFAPVSKQVEAELGDASKCDQIYLQEMLMILFKKAGSKQEKASFKAYLRDLKERFKLKGKSAQVLKRFGV